MGASPKTATCVENSSFRTFAGKSFAIFTLRAVVSPGRMLRESSVRSGETTARRVRNINILLSTVFSPMISSLFY